MNEYQVAPSYSMQIERSNVSVAISNGKEVIDVKLWGDSALQTVNKEDMVLCKNVNTHLFRGIMSLQSTDETEIEIGSTVFTVFT